MNVFMDLFLFDVTLDLSKFVILSIQFKGRFIYPLKYLLFPLCAEFFLSNTIIHIRDMTFPVTYNISFSI